MAEQETAAKEKERLVQIASELFFFQGYRATSLEQILAAAGMGKAQFRQYFSSKQELCQAYLRRRNDEDADAIWACVSEKQTARERFFALLECIGPWLGDNRFRGCAFLNIVGEFPTNASLPLKEGVAHYERVRGLAVHLAQELINSEPKRYAHLDAVEVAEEYMVILTGTIALATIYQNARSLAPAIAALNKVLAPPGKCQ